MWQSKDLASAEIFVAGRMFNLASSDALQEWRVLSHRLLLLCHSMCHQGLGRAEGTGADMKG